MCSWGVFRGGGDFDGDPEGGKLSKKGPSWVLTYSLTPPFFFIQKFQVLYESRYWQKPIERVWSERPNPENRNVKHQGKNGIIVRGVVFFFLRPNGVEAAAPTSP